MDRTFKLVVYVPVGNSQALKDALFAAGAGRQGNYADCCWETEGIGQFMPLNGSSPSIGRLDQIERVAETRLEMLVNEVCVEQVLAALRQAHPYEEPAFDLFERAEYG